MKPASAAAPACMFTSEVQALWKTWDALRALPWAVRKRAIVPVHGTEAVEPSLRACKLRGMDGSGRLCFYHHRFVVRAVEFDCDDLPYPRILQSETVTAVRTRAGQWRCRSERYEAGSGRQASESDSGFRVVAAKDLPR